MSFASQSTQQKFPYSYENVFEALLKIIPETGLTLKDEDKVLGRITASTGMSLFSFGENIVIIVEKIDGSSSTVAIESALKLGSNISGAHRHQKNFNKIISAMSKYLQQNVHADEKANGDDDMEWVADAFTRLRETLSPTMSKNIEEMKAVCVAASDTLGQIQKKLAQMK